MTVDIERRLDRNVLLSIRGADYDANPKIEKRPEGYYSTSVAENLKIRPHKRVKASRTRLNTILAKEHPLANTFAVGANAEPETQRMAEEVIGFELGETVAVKLPDPHRGSSPRYNGRSGAVVVINPADIEVGVDLAGTVTWFRPDEVVSI